jgi:hypothetical protein
MDWKVLATGLKLNRRSLLVVWKAPQYIGTGTTRQVAALFCTAPCAMGADIH